MKSVSKVEREIFGDFGAGEAKLPLRVAPFDVPIAQTWLQVAKICSFIDHRKIAMFVELGIWKGGFSALLMLRSYYVTAFCYVGVENNITSIDPRVLDYADTNPNFTIILDDIFSQETQDKIARHIGMAQGPAFVYCDGGNKPLELKTYAPLIRTGDYIACHDYPGEVQDKHLEFLNNDPDFIEIEPDTWRSAKGMGIPVFQRIENQNQQILDGLSLTKSQKNTLGVADLSIRQIAAASVKSLAKHVDRKTAKEIIAQAQSLLSGEVKLVSTIKRIPGIPQGTTIQYVNSKGEKL